MTTEAQQVHIDTLYQKFEALDKKTDKRFDKLSEECQEHHRIALDATRATHERIDNFTSIMLQMGEMNKEVQSAVAHIRVLESEKKEIEKRVGAIELKMAGTSDTVEGVRKVAWGVAGVLALAIGGALLKLIGL